MPWTTSSKHGEREDEEDCQTSTVKGTSDKVRVVPEDARSVVSEVELDKEAGENLAQDNASLTLVVRNITSELDELGEVDIGNIKVLDLGVKLETVSQLLQKLMTGELYLVKDSVEHNQTGTNKQTERNELISTTKLVKITSKSPRGCVGVVRLHGSTTPGRVTIAVTKEVSVAADDADHDSVVDKATKNSSPDLSEEHDTRRDFDCILVSIDLIRLMSKTYDIRPS